MPPAAIGNTQAMTASILPPVSSAWCTAQRSALIECVEPSTPATIRGTVPARGADISASWGDEAAGSALCRRCLQHQSPQGRERSAIAPAQTGPSAVRWGETGLTQPAQKRILRLGRDEPDPRVHRAGSVGAGDHRVEVKLGD